MAQLCPLSPKKLLALQDRNQALKMMTRTFEDEILDQLDDLDRVGLPVDNQVIEGFGLGLLEDLVDSYGPETELYQEAVERAILRVQGIRQISH